MNNREPIDQELIDQLSQNTANLFNAYKAGAINKQSLLHTLAKQNKLTDPEVQKQILEVFGV